MEGKTNLSVHEIYGILKEQYGEADYVETRPDGEVEYFEYDDCPYNLISPGVIQHILIECPDYKFSVTCLTIEQIKDYMQDMSDRFGCKEVRLCVKNCYNGCDEPNTFGD